jgi:hypothetical protein
MKLGTSLAMVFAGLIASSAQADQADTFLQGGSYEVTYRLEVPHVEEWATDSTARICVRNPKNNEGIALPVLSVNNPLSKCPANSIHQIGDILSFNINCHEREGARAKAVYKLKLNAFQGRIAMTMGGKNMTFVEVQSGRRVGSCDLVGDPAN